MKLVNMTPHPVVMMDSDEEVIDVILPEGKTARCSMQRSIDEQIEICDGRKIPITSVTLGRLEGLPSPQADTLFIVSRVAAEAAKQEGRTDVVCPDDAVRNEQGHIIGCKALARV